MPTTAPASGATAWARAWRLTRVPALEWQAIAAEPALPWTAGLRFLLPLLLASAAAWVVGIAGIGLTTDGFSYKLGWATALIHAGIGVLLALVGVGVLGVVAWRLAPRFGAQPDSGRAFVAVLHAGAPVYLAALLLVWPALPRLWILGALWSVWVLHLGLSTLMRPAERRAVPYTAAVVATALLLAWLLSLTGQCAPGRFVDEMVLVELPSEGLGRDAGGKDARAAGGGQREQPADGQGGTGTAGAGQGGAGGPLSDFLSKDRGIQPGVGTGMSTGSAPPTRTVLDTFLPGDVDGYSRQIVDNYAFVGSAEAGEAANLLGRGAYVNVRYQATDRSRRSRSLSITDMSTFGAMYSDQLLGEVAETGGERDLQGGRIRRTVTEDGQRWIVTEFQDSTDPNRRFGRYEVLLGKRYKLVAEATGLSLAELRDWVSTLDLAGLEARAKANKPIE